MPEENQNPEDDDQAQTGDEPVIDQSSIDAMVQNAEDSQAEELESMLDGIEENSDKSLEGEGASESDQLEGLVESMEEDSEESPDELDELDALAAAFDDVEETSEEASEGAEEPQELIEDQPVSEAEDLDSLLSELDDDPEEEPAAETKIDSEAGELIEDLVDDSGDERIEDVDSLLEDLDDATEATPADVEGEADVIDSAATVDDLDVDASEEDAETVGTLLEDLDEDEDTVDVVELAENLAETPELSEETTELDDEATADLLEDLDLESETEVLETEDLLTEDDETPEVESDTAEEEVTESLLDDTFDDLDLDDDSVPDLDLDDSFDLAGKEDETVEEESVSDQAEDDLDSLLGDSMLEYEDELFETDLNVGVEHEVAHMLATGKPAPTDEGESLFEDFAGVQAGLEDESPETGGTILIVDDDADNIGLFQDALVEGDYEFEVVSTSEKALLAVQTQNIDLVLVNMDTEDNHGFVTVDAMADDDTPPIPVVVTSEESELIEGALQAGAADHFTRPVGIVDLEYQVPKTVSNLIKLKRAQHILSGVAAAPDTGSPSSAASDDLDDLLDDDTDDLLLDDDDSLFGDDDSSYSSSDLEDDDEEDIGPAGRLAAGPDGDRLAPLSDQSKMAREHEWTQTRKSAVSNFPIYLGIGLLVVILAGLSGMVTMYVIDMKEAEIAETQAIQPPQPVPVLKLPRVQQADYEVSRSRVRQPNDYQRQAESVKTRIRNTVRELDAQNGAWWSPWRVMSQAGGTVGVLVSGRGNDEIIDAFGVDRSAVREGLRSRRSMNYLRGVGYDLAGKDVDDLTARETFELLSAREIKTQNHIVDVLSRLTDSLAGDKAEQARRENRKRKRQGTASLSPERPKPAAEISQAKTETPVSGRLAKPNLMKQFGFAIRLPGVSHSGEAG